MNIISWNVNGLRAIVRKEFFTSIEKLDPDILCLQETKAQGSEVREALAPLDGYHTHANSADKKGYSGTALLSKSQPLKVIDDMGIDLHDAEGRIQCAEYPGFYLVNVYVPNSGQQLDRLDYRQQWDADFLNYLKSLEKSKPVGILTWHTGQSTLKMTNQITIKPRAIHKSRLTVWTISLLRDSSIPSGSYIPMKLHIPIGVTALKPGSATPAGE